MSLIHEALKKAEAQRRLGEPPTLGTPVSGRRKRSPLLPVLGGLIAVALGAGWWLSNRPQVDDAPTAPADAPVKTGVARASAPSAAKAKAEAPVSSAAERRPVANPDAPPAQVAGGPVNQAPVTTQPATVKEVAERESEPHPAGTNPLAPGEAAPNALGTPPPASVANDPAGVAAKAAAKQGQPAPPVAVASAPSPGTAKAASPLGNANTNPPPAPPSVIKTPAATSVQTPPVHAPPVAAAPPASAATPAATPPAAVATPPASAAAPPPPPAENLPLYWQLPLNIRKDLPALKLSMHVYSPTPDQRFIILNGNRQKEGDDLGADVRLAEIRIDGAVLEFHGQRFLVPRGGS